MGNPIFSKTYYNEVLKPHEGHVLEGSIIDKEDGIAVAYCRNCEKDIGLVPCNTKQKMHRAIVTDLSEDMIRS